MRVDIKTPFTRDDAAKLRAGDIVYIPEETPLIKEWLKALRKTENFLLKLKTR